MIEGKEVYTLTGDKAFDNKMRNNALKRFVTKVLCASGLEENEIKLCTSIDEVSENDSNLTVNGQKVTPTLDRLYDAMNGFKTEEKMNVGVTR